MPLPITRSNSALALLLLASALFTACASTPSEKASEPQPQSIHLRSDIDSNPGPSGPRLVKKDLFNIVVGPKTLTVNGSPLKNLNALENLLRKYEQPALTVATHRCLSTEKAAEVLSLAQGYTNTPIAFGSYGNIDDPECQ